MSTFTDVKDGTIVSTEEKQCPYCGMMVVAYANFCTNCGERIGSRKCPQCGNTVESNAKFCSECGTRLDGGAAAQPKRDTHQYVDLGLPSGTLWATCNVGATNPEDAGDYFAWGETTPKSTYSWDNYTYCREGSSLKLTKYCNMSDYGYNGFTDSRTTLEKSDDAATANWGSDWCMPTQEQFQELYDNCTTEWTTNYQGKGVAGRLFKSKRNDNTIFFPVAGVKGSDGKNSCVRSLGIYLSSSLNIDRPNTAHELYFDSSDVRSSGNVYRDGGFTVRPVRCR